MKKLLGCLMVMGLVVSFAAAEEAKKEGYTTSIAAGVSATDGNSDVKQGTVNVLTEGPLCKGALRAGADFAYGEIGGDTTNENGKAFAGYRQPIQGELYGLLDNTLSYDAIADVDYRLIVAPGLGYNLMNKEKVKLAVEGGPAYVWEEVGNEQDDYLALRFAERYDRKLAGTSKCWQSVEYLPRSDDFDDYLLNAEIGLEGALTEKAALRLVVGDKYDSTPAPGREENDVTVTGSLVYTL